MEVPLAKSAGVEILADKRVSELTKLRRKVQAGDLPDKKDHVKAINKEIEGTMRLLNQAVAEILRSPINLSGIFIERTVVEQQILSSAMRNFL